MVDINEPGGAFTSGVEVKRFAPAVEAMIPPGLLRSGKPIQTRQPESHYAGKKIIGIHGFAQTGKDSIGRVLFRYNYRRLAFADAVRDAVYAMNSIIQPETTLVPDEEGVGYFRKPLVRVQDVVDAVGWEAGKKMHSELRLAQQKMGTEVGRMIFGENVWVDIVDRQIVQSSHDKFVITDVRFPNELAWLKRTGGTAVYVKRPGVGPVNDHVSDAGLPEDEFDYVIDNDGDLDDLDRKVAELLQLTSGS